MLAAIEQLSQVMAVADACSGLGFPRSSYYRLRSLALPLHALTAKKRTVRAYRTRSAGQTQGWR